MKNSYIHNLRKAHSEYVSNQFILNKGNSKKTIQLCNKKIKKIPDSSPEQLTHIFQDLFTNKTKKLIDKLPTITPSSNMFNHYETSEFRPKIPMT